MVVFVFTYEAPVERKKRWLLLDVVSERVSEKEAREEERLVLE